VTPDPDALQDELEELRAEVTRLRARQAEQQDRSWLQRHPLWALSLTAVVGGAAGYGLAVATRQPPPPLSEQARRRLRAIADEARRAAQDVGEELSDRAARSGEQVRAQARKQGATVREEAGTLLREAAARAREAGTDAGESLRTATQEATDEAQAAGEALAEDAGAALDDASDAAQEALTSANRSPALRQSVYAAAGLAAGLALLARLRE
jgi:hypothetical protein